MPKPRPTERSAERRDQSKSNSSGLRFLVESAAYLNSSLELNQVFHKVADRVLSFLDCHLFCVLLWNERTQLLEHSFSLRYGEHIDIKEARGFPLGYGISGKAAVERRPIRVPDVSVDPHYVRYRHPEVRIRSEMAVPLILKGRLIGVLDLESVELDAFAAEHEQIVSALASHIAIALENARLYERLLREERRLEEDLATAREIQAALLPKDAAAEGVEIGYAFQPARELAGDFYDFLRYPDGRLAIAVGDVSGKATAAALYGSMAVGILRGHVVRRSYEAAEILQLMNQALHRTELDNRFLAMSFAVFDPRDSTVSLAAAGFPWPLLVRNREVENVLVEGLPLGMFPDSRYESKQIQLRPGDALALCSDGLTEAVNDEDELFGLERLQRSLKTLSARSAQNIASSLVEITGRFGGGPAEFNDDKTVVVLKGV